MLYAAKRAGATDVARTGGAQAVAAMAYGTESIPSVDRIVGPGNVYVTEAKRQVAGSVGIDGLAGPSELAIVADGHVDPRMAALDLIAQAEHDPEARTFFITPDAALAEKVDAALEQELVHVDRREIVDLAIRHTRLVLVRDLAHAAAAVNDVAAEHLLLLLDEPEDFLPSVRNAGAIFLGLVVGRPVRRLRALVQPRPSDRRDRPVLERVARSGLRHHHLGDADVARRGRALQPGHLDARPGRRPGRTREGDGGPRGRGRRPMTAEPRERLRAA